MRHIIGLSLAGLLALGAWGLWLWLPRLVAGTPLQDLRLLLTFLCIVGLLSLGEGLWHLLRPRRPDA